MRESTIGLKADEVDAAHQRLLEALAMEHLREFAAAGDPFSLAILEGREVP